MRFSVTTAKLCQLSNTPIGKGTNYFTLFFHTEKGTRQIHKLKDVPISQKTNDEYVQPKL